MRSGQQALHITLTLDGQTSKKTFEVDAVLVGRNPDCSIPIMHNDVSRKHVSFYLRGEEIWVEDMGSSNGTFINAIRIKPKTPQVISENDKITLGTGTGIVIFASVQPEISAEGTEAIPVAPVLEKVAPPEPLPFELKPLFPQAQAVSEPQVDERKRIVREAKAEADEIIRVARLNAEQQVQDVFERAQRTQKEADDFYRQRMEEATEAVESMRVEARRACDVLMSKTRQACEDLRNQTDTSVSELRTKTRNDCNQMYREMELHIQKTQAHRLQEMESDLENKEAQIIEDAKKRMEAAGREQLELMQIEKQEHEQRLREERTAHDQRIREERSAHEQRIREESTAHEQSLRQEMKAMEERRAEVELLLKSEIDQKRRDLEGSLKGLQDKKKILSEQCASDQAMHESLTKKILEQQTSYDSLRAGVDRLEVKTQEAEANYQDLIERTRKIDEDLAKRRREFEDLHQASQALEARREQGEKELESELIELKKRLEGEKDRLTQEEQEHLLYLKRESAKKIQQAERELLTEISRKKSAFVREILLTLENSSSLIGGHISDWRKESSALEERLLGQIDSQLYGMQIEGSVVPEKINLNSRRRKERFLHIGLGTLMGVLGVLGTLHGLKKAYGPSPLERAVASQAEARKADLLQRKFNPEKSWELRPTYVDAVIYTDQYVEITTSDEYQKKWSLALAKHLLKLWKVEEDSTFQVTSISNALVKTLEERKGKIHPDFVKDGLRKMKEAEADAVKRMTAVLGSQVRYESMRKFEKDFFNDYRRRNPAAAEGEPQP